MKRIAKGDLLRRMKLNRKRLRSKIYSYPGVFYQDQSWPGDWQGRCILALTSLYFSFYGYEKEQKDILNQLDEITSHLKDYTNRDGYFGDLVNNEFVNEQQVSGNSWYLRGLIEYYQITKEQTYLDLIKKIVDNFILKISGFYSHYPLSSRELGGVGGHSEGKIKDGWLTSSDVGCAFIMLDAMSEAYYLLKDEKLKEVLVHTIDSFMKIDFVGLKCQTHATLSCARGILTFYQATKEEKYLAYAKDIFEKYVEFGMTKDYSNINWFNRPDTWTEPCCVVDSFILSSQLYEITNETKFLTLLNRIYLNSFRMAQRANGGAGCNTCLYDKEKEIQGYLYEAYFCCTMRFAEGLRFVKKYSALWKDSCLTISLLMDLDLDICNGASLSIKGDIYNKEKVSLSFSNVKQPTKVKIYIPDTIKFSLSGVTYSYENEYLCFEITKDCFISISFDLSLHHEKSLCFAGDMLLVKRNECLEKKSFSDQGKTYYYLLDYSKVHGKEKTLSIKQVL